MSKRSTAFFLFSVLGALLGSSVRADTRIILPPDLTSSRSVSQVSSGFRWSSLGLAVQSGTTPSFSIPSRFATPESFSTPSVPLSQIVLRFTGFESLGIRHGVSELDFGLGIQSFSRKGYASFMGPPEVFSQTLTLIPVQLGYRRAVTGSFGKSGLTSFFRLGGGGIMAVSPRSIFESGQTYWGLRVQASVGVEWKISTWGLSVEPFAAVDRFAKANLNTFGAQASVWIYP